MEKIRKQFSKIYDQYINKIYRFVYLKVNSQEVAEDITSKVFLRGWDSFRANHDKIENPSAFLYQIARNLVIDYYREKGKTQFVSSDFIPDVVDPGVNIEEGAILNANLDMVKNALANMKDDYQNVVIWHYLDEMPIPEVAKLLERSEEATRVLLHRALNLLRQNLTI
jgi:RNA polymerase sigma-70 factor (ECF subfamily)